ncbi:MAG TPA: bifunctional phosphoribosylaminoimidazolecarboxamide formyltransferase/IMP cyclohydrolase [Candidatus Deferrimicrobium sp.]|nr:bifunctional phosphoribosylaminoimidazolecarboxamide formyltransferase/IMP cyclohydrolase [Candidatus Deferrimicrobium sp.]
MIQIKQALLSVSNKEGLVEFAKELQAMNIEIISTGGTFNILQKAGIAVLQVSEITQFPEMMDGRVKTLHPKIHGAILARRDKDEHLKELKKHNIKPIDLVVVNLYPFRETISKSGVILEDAIEQIDIGGPTLIRSSAKNFEGVVILVNPKNYPSIVAELKRNKGKISLETSRKLAVEAFQHTMEYDSYIYNYLSNQFLKTSQKFPPLLNLTFKKAQDLRYGENPHQEAAFYVELDVREPSIGNAKQIHGKELSFNNIYDVNAALELVKEFGTPVAAIIKHTNPCGLALGKDTYEAYKLAHATDPLSAFGSIVAFNRTVTKQTANEIIKTFVEVVIAPDFEEVAFDILRERKDLRLLVTGSLSYPKPSWDWKKVEGGILVQDRDLKIIEIKDLKYVTEKHPTPKQLDSLLFAWKIIRHIKSNAILLVKDKYTTGIGAGQMSRIDSVNLAIKKAGENANGSVMASDAFFPFRDSIDAAVDAGILAIIEPGGSIRDQEVIDAANKRGIPLVFTGFRCFRH